MDGHFANSRKILVSLLSGFLILLHVAGLWDAFQGGDLISADIYANLQALLSVAIITSLLLLILGRKIGLVSMWASIIALVLTQYGAHFGFYDADFTEGRSAISYLRGFMFPTAITLLYLFPQKLTR
jgi:hypothetical protein